MVFDPAQYGPVLAQWLDVDRDRPLDAGQPVLPRRGELLNVTPALAFSHDQVADADMAACCIAGMLLLHDCIHESHSISQQIHSACGSFWHAIMHRREGDYSNSKYWFRKVGVYAVFPPLCATARRIAESASGDHSAIARVLAGQNSWDPFQFVDLCQEAVDAGGDDERLLRRVQQAEWELLFDHCFRGATGRD